MIQLDPDVFTFQPVLDMSFERFVVRDVEDSGPVLTAVARALDRFMDVDTTGVEHQTSETMSAAVDAGADSPSYVSDPEITESGIEGYVDCKGVIVDEMAAKMREILAEELEGVGYSGRVSVVSVQDRRTT